MQFSVASLIWNYMTVGNIILAVMFLFLLNLLIELYEFRGMPPGPRFYTLPVIGNLLMMKSKGTSLHENTQGLRDRYGRVFSLKLGGWKTVIATSPESVNEVLVKKSEDFAGRPQYWSILVSSYGKDLVMGDYGPAWRLHRKLFFTTLRQFLKDVTLCENKIVNQVQRVLHFMEEQNGAAFDPNDIFITGVVNIITKITFGEDYDIEQRRISDLLKSLENRAQDSDLNSANSFLDLFYIARFFSLDNYKKSAELAGITNEMLRKLLREQEKHLDFSKPATSLTTALLKARNQMKVENEEEKNILLTEDHMVTSMADMFSAGSETVAGTLLWCIAFMVNYPKFQVQLQEHIDQVVGRDRFPSLEDRSNLPLIQATIMEIQRLGNVVDAAVPHRTIKDTTLCGYRVPKDTLVLVDLESVHLDPECFENPEEFNPHRYINSEGQLITKQENWLPFGAGRRSCAGEPLAKVELFMFLSIMLHQFTFGPEDGKNPPSLKAKHYMFTKYPQSYKVKAIKRL